MGQIKGIQELKAHVSLLDNDFLCNLLLIKPIGIKLIIVILTERNET